LTFTHIDRDRSLKVRSIVTVDTIRSDIMSHKLHFLLFFLVLVVAALLRILYLSQPMRHDEALTFLEFASTPATQIVANYRQPNNHVLHSLLVHLSYSLFGNEPWILRLPAFIAGMLLVPVVYLLSRTFYNRHAALLAAGLTAVSLPLVEYSTNARGYTLFTLIFVAQLGLAHYLKTHNRFKYWLLFALLAALGFYTIPVMVFPFGVVCVWLVLSIIREHDGIERQQLLASFYRSLIFAAVVTIILYLRIILTSGVGVLVGNDAVVPLPNGAFLEALPGILGDIVTFPLRGFPLEIVILLIMGILAAVLAHHKMSSDKISLVVPVLLWILPVLLIQRGDPGDRTWIFLVPVFTMLASAGLVHLTSGNRTLAYIGTLAIVITAGASLIVSNAVLRSDQTGSAPDAEKMALGLQTIRQPGDIVLLPAPYDAPVRYYLAYHGYSADFVRNQRDIEQGFRLEDVTGRIFVWGLPRGSTTAFIDTFRLDYAPFDVVLQPMQLDANPPLQEIVFANLPPGVLFTDTFADGVSEGWRFSEIEAQIVSDDARRVLDIRTGDQWGEMILVGGERWVNYSLELDVKVMQPTSEQAEDFYANVRHIPTIGNYNGTINTRDNRAHISAELNGEWSGYLSETEVPLAESVWHWLNLRATGSTIEFFVNDAPIASVRDGSVLYGTIRIVIPPNTHIRIDDVVVRQL
jgi:hypothetical protein